MSRLRLIVLGCLALGLLGCNAGKKANPSKSGTVDPPYSWNRPPEDWQPPPLPPNKPGELDPF